MLYLLSQIWLCLLITALVSGLLGWVLRGGGKDKLRALNTQWQDKYDLLSQERNNYASKINKLAGISHENDRLERKIKAQKQSFDQTVKHLNKDLINADNEIQRQELLLIQKDEELTMSMAQFDQKITEFEEGKHLSNPDLAEKITKLEEALKQEKEQAKLQLSHLKAENKTQQQQITTLQENLATTTAELATAKNKLKLAEEKTTKAQQEKDKILKTATKKEENKDSPNSHQENIQEKADDNVLPIHSIQALSDEDEKRLSLMKINTTKDLLAKTSTDTGIKLLAKSLGKETWVIRTWVNNADLIRIKGVDGILAELLELSGIHSVEKLAKSNVDEISKAIKTVYQHISKRSKAPNNKELQALIDEAKILSGAG